jgi:hypothetical protein
VRDQLERIEKPNRRIKSFLAQIQCRHIKEKGKQRGKRNDNLPSGQPETNTPSALMVSFTPAAAAAALAANF